VNHSSLLALKAVWLAVIGVETALCVLLSVRRAIQEYPAFFAFVLFSTSRSLLLLSMNFWHAPLYKTVQWLIYVPQLAILFAVVLEVLNRVFHPFETLPRNTVGHFIGAIATISLFAVTFAILHPGAQPTAWATFATAADQAVSWILCAVFMLVALFSSYFGIPWRHRVYGIALGFLVFLTTDVFVTTAITQLRLPPLSLVRLLDMIAFLSSCVIWGYYFLAREVAGVAPETKQVEELARLVRSISTLLPSRDE
jgi:hypothetical protein